MNPTSLIYSLYEIGAIKFGNFILKSGKTSKIYLDIRQVISYPALLRTVSTLIWQKIPSHHFDLICGVPYTALPIATCLSLQHNIPMVLRRKETKSYGTKQQIEGAFQPGQTCLIIEDVVTTGSSILDTAQDLEAAGLKIIDIGFLINREEGGIKNLHQKNYRAHCVFTLSEILHTLINSALLSEHEYTLAAEFLHESMT